MPLHDSDLEYLLHVIGYTLSSHVMCRASLSRGTGRSEEVLTADLCDLFALHGDTNLPGAYLSDRGSPSELHLYARDLHKRQEGVVGADFVVVMRGLDTDGSNLQPIHKIVAVQAKRLDYDHSPLRYKRSTNHVAHAQQMVRHFGARNAFFAFYHSDEVTSQCRRVTWPKGRSAPPFYFAAPRHGEHYYFDQHPSMSGKREVFIEPSAYRDWYKKRNGEGFLTLPDNFEWGIAVLTAHYFVDEQGREKSDQHALPSVNHVLSKCKSFQGFLVALATCQRGEDLPEREFWVKLRQLLRSSTTSSEAGSFDAQFALGIEFCSRTQHNAAPDWPLRLGDLLASPDADRC